MTYLAAFNFRGHMSKSIEVLVLLGELLLVKGFMELRACLLVDFLVAFVATDVLPDLLRRHYCPSRGGERQARLSFLLPFVSFFEFRAFTGDFLGGDSGSGQLGASFYVKFQH